MRRFLVTVSMVAALSVLAAGCSTGSTKAPQFEAKSGKVRVAASFYPVYEFARAVGGDKIDLVNMVPPGTEPHDWEPTARHMKTLNEAQLFLYSGVGMETWVPKTLKSIDNKDIAVVEASKSITLLQAPAGEDDGHGHEKKDDHADEFDPHVWLDPLSVARQVEAIRDGLILVDAANKATYEANAAAYIEQLKALDSEFKTGLSQCKTRTFFTTHAAFGYLANRYNLEQHAIMGLSPDAEPKPKALANIVDEAKKDNVKYIFFETLVSDKVAKMVAKEIGASTLVLNPFEGLTDEEIKAGKSYLTVMRDNLTNLKTAMECGK